jgi:hypothetical protein
MSLDVVLARINQLQSLFPAASAPAAPLNTATSAAATASSSSSPTTSSTASFASQLQSATSGTTGTSALLNTTATGAAPASSAGQAILNAVRGEVGVSEQPPGSNDSPRIAQYRQATAGSAVGPWCAYFVSWAARQAGVPIGTNGQGTGSVSGVYQWAQQTGKAIPNGPGVTPQAGDLIVWGGEHIGVVESVDGDGTIHTIEGNSANQVARRTYAPGERPATGYVRLG